MKQYKTPEHLRLRVAEYQRANPLKIQFLNARSRAKLHGREFTLTRADVERLRCEAGTHCPACGNEMTAPGLHAPSLDRVHNDLGYTPENVVVICKRCNSTKRAMDGAQLLQLAQFVLAQEARAG